MEDSLVYTVKECAEIMKISESSLRRNYLCRIDFPKVKVPGSRRILIPRKALESWLNNHALEKGVL